MTTKTKRDKKMELNRKILKIILNVWSVITMMLFVVDFFSGGRYDSSTSAIGVIYLALLGIYVGEKEYIRWSNHFVSKYIGESFVVVWTALMIMFAVMAPFSEGKYHVPTEFAIIYTSIIGIFAVTRHSKGLKGSKNG